LPVRVYREESDVPVELVPVFRQLIAEHEK
jgi:hypothetical protein